MSKLKQVSNFGVQATFDPLAFAQLIQFHGMEYWWSRAVECPCRLNADTDQFNPTCSRCGDDGWLYVNPCAAQERHTTRDYTLVRAVFSTVGGSPTVTDVIGSLGFGEATLTVQGEMFVGYRDRFIGVNQQMARSELLIRGASDLVPVGWAGLTSAEQRTAMRYEPVQINYVEDDDGAGNRTIYYAGSDFILKNGGPGGVNQMQWLAGQGPPAGRLYVVHYSMHPVWVVDESVYLIQNSRGPAAGLKGQPVDQNLPTTFKVKLDWLTQNRAAA